MAGPRRSPDLMRYDDVARMAGLYVIEAGAAIKVGITNRCLFTRLRELHMEHRRAAEALGRFSVFPQLAGNLYELETECVRALREAAATLTGHREYFSGIDFDAAERIVVDVVSREQQRHAPMVFRSSEKGFANACEKQSEFRGASQ